MQVHCDTWCTLAQIQVYYWIVKCSGHPDKLQQSMSTCSQLSFCSSAWKRVGYGMEVQTRLDVSRMVEYRAYVTIECQQEVIYAASIGTTTDDLL